MSTEDSSFKKTPIIIALVLGVLLVIGVLIGAKVVFDKAALQPVAMATLDTPEANSEECAQFLAALPDSVIGHRRVGIVDPAPPGAAAWKSSSIEQVTVRCGVELPFQYTALSTLDDVSGTSWLTVVDATPGSSMRTMYAVNRNKVVAVTTDEQGLGSHTAIDLATDLAPAIETLAVSDPSPHPIPLATVDSDPATAQQCAELLADLPESIGTETRYTRVTDVSLPDKMAAWRARDREPIALRCGVSFPENYAAGARLQQVNEIAWFEDTVLGNGTTAATWYPVGRDINIAVSMPQSIGNPALVSLGDVIATHTQETK